MNSDIVMAVCTLVAAVTVLVCSLLGQKVANEVYKLAQAEEERRKRDA